MLAWDDSYSTGFSEIDDQHKKLFQVINKLGERIEKGNGVEELDKVLSFLEKYCEMHFAYEEECMAKHKCPVAGKNKKAHEIFIEGYHSYLDRYEKLGVSPELVKDIHKECEQWLVEHICKIDIHLKECASKND